MSNGSGANQRAHIRHSVQMPACLVIGQENDIEVTVQDFCLGGMLVRFNDAALPAESLLSADESVTVSMSVEGLRGPRQVSLNARVVRVDAGGAGVRFDNPDATALLAVQNHVRSMVNSQREQQQARKGRPSLGSQQVQAALEATRQVVAAFLHERMEAFLPAAEEALLDAADRMTSNQEQHPYFEACKLLAKSIRQLQSNFLAGVIRNLEAVAQGQQLDAGDTFKSEGGGLSLVDKEMFEDWLTLKVMATRAESSFHDDLLHLQLRFDELFSISLSARRNPLHPAFVCNAFGQALRLLPLKGRTDKVVLGVFETQVVNELCKLYQQCNDILADTGVLSDLDVARYIAERYGAQPLPDRPAPGRKPEPQAAPPRQTVTPASEPSPAPTAAAAEPTPDDQPAQPAIPTSKPAMPSGSAPNLAARQFQLQQHIARHAYETVQKLLSINSLQSARDRMREEVPESSQLPVAEPQQVADTLRSMQQSAADADQPLIERVQEAVAQQTGEQLRLEQDLRAAIEIIQHLFEGILANPAISDGVRGAIRRLELPFLRLLLMDDSFLQQESHPARQVLNRMARLGVRGSANLQRHEQEIRDKAELIGSHFDGDTQVFEQVLSRLDELSGAQEKLYMRNLRRVTESCEGKQKLLAARQEVSQALERRIGGKKIPRAVLSLIDAGWRQLLLQTLLRGGRDSKDWHEFLGVVDRLIKAAAEVPPQEQLQPLLASIKRGLKQVDESQVRNARLLGELRDLLSAVARKTAEPPMVDVPKGMVDVSDVQDQQFDEMQQRWAKRARRCQSGDCFIYTEEDGEPLPVRLAWTDEDRNLFVFVNHQGMSILEFSLAEFAERLADGVLAPADSDEVAPVDQGLEKMVQRVYDQMAQQATRDELTGLFTRREFERRLRHQLTGQPQQAGSLLHMDVDQFKLVNNLGGPEAGDELINKIGALVRDVFPGALAARSGGDEFSLWLQDVTEDGGRKAAESFCQRVASERFECLGRVYSVTLSAGVVHRHPGREAGPELVRAAESACHAAKESGRNRVQVYAEDDRDMARRDDVMTWVTRLNEALDQDRLTLRCQRIEPTRKGTGQPAYEVLISISGDEGEMIPPADFLAAAEQYNRMHALDRWVIANTLKWMHSHPDVVSTLDHLSINLSGHSLNDAELSPFLFEYFQRYPVPRERLCFEVTETAAIANLEDAADFIRELQDMGCRFSLDDFGSGLASYGHLKHLPVDYIKIDGTFIKGIARDQADLALVRSINEMGHLMGKRTIAEYVEDDEVRQCLLDVGVDYVQGYGIEKPRTLDSLAQA